MGNLGPFTFPGAISVVCLCLCVCVCGAPNSPPLNNQGKTQPVSPGLLSLSLSLSALNPPPSHPRTGSFNFNSLYPWNNIPRETSRCHLQRCIMPLVRKRCRDNYNMAEIVLSCKALSRYEKVNKRWIEVLAITEAGILFFFSYFTLLSLLFLLFYSLYLLKYKILLCEIFIQVRCISKGDCRNA